MDINTAVKNFDALAQETRLEIVRLLVKAGPDGVPAGDIATSVDSRQNTVSSHLKTLSEAGLISRRRAGRHIYYAVNFTALSSLIAWLIEDCCGGRDLLCLPESC